MKRKQFAALIRQWWSRKNLVVQAKNDYRKAGRLNLKLEEVLPEEEDALFRQVDSKG